MNKINQLIKEDPALFVCIIIGLPVIVLAAPMIAAIYVFFRFLDYTSKF